MLDLLAQGKIAKRAEELQGLQQQCEDLKMQLAASEQRSEESIQ